MSKFVKLAGLVLAATVAANAAAQAAPNEALKHLPILVDRYYEIKNPAGPVSSRQVPEELRSVQVQLLLPAVQDLQEIPHPQWQQPAAGAQGMAR